MLPANFFIKALSVHGLRYSYAKAGSPDAKGRVCIICPEHGEFWQSPHGHIYGKGCAACGVIRKANTTRKAAGIDFPHKARDIHGDCYDYSHVRYFGNTVKVSILCPLHGLFEQAPCRHLMGFGCPECRKNSPP